MKRIIVTTLASAFALVLVTTSASAQSVSRVDFAQTISGITNHSPAETVAATGEMPTSLVSAKALRSFSKSFKDITPNWYEVNDSYLARFSANGNTTHALYRKNGYRVYSVTRGSEKLLPASVASLLRKAYPDYTINAATHAISQGTTAWFADLTLCDNLIIVKVIDGEIVEATRYRTN
jgi:hypothetical protein